jgi:regulator of sigma D
MAKAPASLSTREGTSGNTPEVDEWLAKSQQLTVAAIALSGQQESVDENTASMMRQVRAGCQTLLTALSGIPLPTRSMMPPINPPLGPPEG